MTGQDFETLSESYVILEGFTILVLIHIFTLPIYSKQRMINWEIHSISTRHKCSVLPTTV